MAYIETDPKIVHELAGTALRAAIAQRRDVSVGIAIYDRDDSPLSQDAFRALHDAVTTEYNRMAAALLLATDRPQHDADADVRAVAALMRNLGSDRNIAEHGLAPFTTAAAVRLEHRFADRIAELNARDAKAGE